MPFPFLHNDIAFSNFHLLQSRVWKILHVQQTYNKLVKLFTNVNNKIVFFKRISNISRTYVISISVHGYHYNIEFYSIKIFVSRNYKISMLNEKVHNSPVFISCSALGSMVLFHWKMTISKHSYRKKTKYAIGLLTYECMFVDMNLIFSRFYS